MLIRQSTLNDQMICGERMIRNIRSTAYSTSEAAARGTAYHAGLEALYIARAQGQDDPSVEEMIAVAAKALLEEERRAENTGGQMKWDTSYDETIASVARALAAYMEEPWYWPGWEVLGVEESFTFPAEHLDGMPPDFRIHGTVDLILRRPDDGAHILVDHKTSGRAWHATKHMPNKTPQPSWYVHWWPLVWMELTESFDEPSAIEFYFDIATILKTKVTFERRQAPVTKRSMTYWTDRARDVAWQLHNDGPFMPNPTSNLCSPTYCDHWDVCPAGGPLADIGEPEPIPEKEESW